MLLAETLQLKVRNCRRSREQINREAFQDGKIGSDHSLISILTSNLPGLIRASSIRSGLLVIPAKTKTAKQEEES